MTDLTVLKSLPVAQLFSLMSNNENFTSISLRAYAEFKERYEKEVWNICKAVCRKNNFHKVFDLDKEVYRISMQEIYLNASSFKESKSKKSKEDQDRLIIGWVGEIAETVMQQILAEDKKYDKLHVRVPDYHEHLAAIRSFQHDADEFIEDEKKKDCKEELLTKRKVIYDSVWMKLKPRERDILLEYYSIKGGRIYLSEDRIAYLCTKWKITLDNLLQIKYRAFKKLERFCEDEQTKTENGSDPLNP